MHQHLKMQKATNAFENILPHIVSLSNKKGIIIMGKIELHILC